MTNADRLMAIEKAITELASKTARIDERTKHIMDEVDRLSDRLDKAAADGDAAEAQIMERVDQIETDMAIVRKLMRAVLSALATIFAAVVSYVAYVLR